MTQTDNLILLNVLGELGDEGYGVTIYRRIKERLGREISIAALYDTLNELERGGLVRSWESPGGRERGYRPRKHFARVLDTSG